MKKVVAPNTARIDYTLRAGKHRHQGYISQVSERAFKKSVFGIARMLVRWRKRRRAMQTEVNMVVAARNLVVKCTGCVHTLAQRIREELSAKNIVSFA